jgi:DNA replication protein DnaC
MMNNSQTIEKLKQMRLHAMAEVHHQQSSQHATGQFTPDEYLALLTDTEWEERQNRKIQRLIQQADFRDQATIAQVSHHHQRNLDKNAFDRLACLGFIDRKENLILTGPSGVGKSYLAQALGHQACIQSKKVRYANTARLFKRLKLAKIDGTYLKELNRLSKVELLILDDFGLHAFDNFARETLMDIIEQRFNKNSTILSSQLPVSTWYEIIGEATIADAILDRLVNSSHRIDLKGESLRKGILKQDSID